MLIMGLVQRLAHATLVDDRLTSLRMTVECPLRHFVDVLLIGLPELLDLLIDFLQLLLVRFHKVVIGSYKKSGRF